MKIYRYPGVRPFQAADKALFFGRDRDIADLYEMVRAERLVVLFGKSGYGKSSLLNAGVLPRLAGVMTPVEVRLGEYIAGQSFSPVETVRRKASVPFKIILVGKTGLGKSTLGTRLQYPDNPLPHKLKATDTFPADLPPSLWTHFKQLDSAEKGSYLLVFDQFEEFFSYPPEQQRAFRDQLADLLNGEPPEALREAARALDREQRRLLTAPMDVRVLFAIRSDRMHELDRLKDRLPAILHKRYELKALSREQAREAIVGPAALDAHLHAVDPATIGDNKHTGTEPPSHSGEGMGVGLNPAAEFASPPFEYKEDALQKILSGLAISNTTQQSGVEAFQLQILCDSIENKVADGLVPDRDGNGLPDVTADDLPDFTEVFAQYYERRLSMLPETERAAARRVIEDGLVRYDPFTDDGRRLSVDGQALLKDYENIGLNPDLLRELENTFLVRREPNTLGGHNYELSHDTLLEPVVRAKKKRMAEEEERRQREALAAEEARIAREKAEAQRRQRRALVTSIVAGALVLGAVISISIAYQQSKKAADAVDLAERKTRDAEISDSLAQIKTRAAAVSDSLAGIEKRNAEAATSTALAAKNEADQKTKEAASAQEAARIAEVKAQAAINQSGIDSEMARLAKIDAEQKKKEADEATLLANQAKAEAERLTQVVVTNLLAQSRNAILHLDYDAAFSLLANAASLGTLRDSVAYELMEIAFFRYHAAQSTRANEPFEMAAKLLGKSGISQKNDIGDTLVALDKGRDSLIKARYFPFMLEIKGGVYQMQDEYETNVPGFQMAQTETTVWQYNLFCVANGRDITQRIGPDGKTLDENKYQPSWGWIGDNPVIYINWYDAAEYANWLSRKMNRAPAYEIKPGEKDSLNENEYDYFKWTVIPRENARGYRLPTEAEWEYAAKGGALRQRFKYSGSDEIDEVAWYDENSDSRTQAVRGKKANGAGLYDMSGNVWEWCFDWYGNLPAETLWGAKSGSYRVFRGGGWDFIALFCQASYRAYSDPNSRHDYFSFRLAFVP